MPPDPLYHPVYYDSCAFDGGDDAEQKASIEARELFEKKVAILRSFIQLRKK